ncbi:Protein OPI10 [Colletotrichum sidae]|uniref:Protein OPI10 n=4 Tax=Colletotrichum orbiculare species complex TaxID=2707354 RepID=N4VMJ3_COLOR|nr:Protein OPI10 [Colletotrichum orbiculare MAFF 240422]TDZ27600.1 Protein OPI10 [Colletotrichum trifolii]TDZ28696.1 Protein OPI10 [Colletotrichum spinosum]TEA07959.1 Protein OPI10 [Colletotrichum sidae]
MSGPLFGIVPTGQPLLTEPTSAPSETSFLYSIPTARPFSHITVVILPGVILPPDMVAAIYFATTTDVTAAAAKGQPPHFKFLGAVGAGKESAVFKINAGTAGVGDAGNVMIGISAEPAEAVVPRLQELSAIRSAIPGGTSASQPSSKNTLHLAQNIIKNAFNFLASFSGTAGPGGVEVVPLKAFEEWWKKFESRVRSDPSFLEKNED